MGFLRVIGGERKGFRLAVLPSGLNLRPTSSRVREALFDILASRVEGSRVLDLFAGTGAVGIEALSRGAKTCVFVERDRKFLKILRENLRRCGFDSRGRVLGGELPTVLRRLVGPETFDIVFADPPYGDPVGEWALGRIADLDLVSADSVIVLEHPTSGNPLSSTRSLAWRRSAGYGDTTLSFFQRVDAAGSRADEV